MYRSIPVDRAGVTVGALRKVRKALNDGHAIVMFPEGTRSTDGRLRAPKEGIGLLMSQANAVVVPVYIEGLFGVKGSIFRRPKAGLHFGEPIHVGQLLENAASKREKYALITQAVMQNIEMMAREKQDDSVFQV